MIEVDETGILDCRTLAIPYLKLAARARRVSDRLDAEDEAVKLLQSTDAKGAALKKKFASYLRDKSNEATGRLNALNEAVFAVPQKIPDEPSLSARADAGGFNGLRGLEIPAATRYELMIVGGDSGSVRLASVDERFEPERFDSRVVDPQAITPAIVADIQQKEAAAEKAVSFAENLCKDLLTPPCQ